MGLSIPNTSGWVTLKPQLPPGIWVHYAQNMMAVGQGFEPWKGGYPLRAFEARAFDHSAIPPHYGLTDRCHGGTRLARGKPLGHPTTLWTDRSTSRRNQISSWQATRPSHQIGKCGRSLCRHCIEVCRIPIRLRD